MDSVTKSILFMEHLDEKERRFLDACRGFDHSYMFSDDHGKWKMGINYRDTLHKMAKELEPERAVSIYNQVVDECFTESREQFYWTEVPGGSDG